jgi:Ion channel
MSGLETALLTVAGVGLIAVACRDIFDTLFHPEGHSHLGRGIARAVWLLLRRLFGNRPPTLALAGPLAIIAVIGTWATMLIVGWALVFLPHVDGGFRVPASAAGGDLVDALNISLVTLTTVGFGDATPEAGWLRLVTPMEALLGFGLLSASVSWLLLVYPVLARRRSLAYEVSLLRREEEETGVNVLDLEPEVAERVLADLTSRLIAAERDLVNFPVTYYFVESDERFSLAATVSYLVALTERASGAGMSERVQLRGHLLAEALGDLGTTSRAFHRSEEESVGELLEAYARDHLRRTT